MIKSAENIVLYEPLKIEMKCNAIHLKIIKHENTLRASQQKKTSSIDVEVQRLNVRNS